MIQGTKRNAAFKIAENGFGIVSSQDSGFYGQGIYFTSSVEYAKKYSPEGMYVVAMVAVGEVYPAVEHHEGPDSLKGKSCIPGYHSHYALVNQKGSPLSPPDSSSHPHSNHFDELVVFESFQALPLFVIEAQNTKSFSSVNQKAAGSA